MPPPLPALDILAAHAAANPDRVALVEDGGRRVTYAALNARVNRVVHAIASLGVRRGDRCLHINHNSIEGFELGHALRKLQVVNAPVNWRLVAPEIAHLLRDSRPTVLVAGEEFTGVVDEARSLVGEELECSFVAIGAAPTGWLSYEGMLASAGTDEPEAQAQLSGPTMVYTAGTTGQPKGAYRGSGVDVDVLMAWIEHLHLRSDDVHLLAGPGYHSAPAAMAGLQQAIGSTTVIQRRFDPRQALDLIDAHRVTTTFMAPTLVRRILDVPQDERGTRDVSSMRALIVGAAPFPPALKRRAVDAFGPCVYEFYGASETGIVTLMPAEDLMTRPGSCGRLMPGVELKLLDDDGAEVVAGTPGEIWTRSAGMLQEYYGRGEETERSRRDGFFSVGDIGVMDAEGYLTICDRRADMILSGGVNVYPAEIEGVLAEHPDVADCAVIGVPDDEWGEVIHAIVLPREGHSPEASDLRGWCQGRMSSYKVPRSVEFVDEFPRDPAGKLLKRVLRDGAWSATGRSV